MPATSRAKKPSAKKAAKKAVLKKKDAKPVRKSPAAKRTARKAAKKAPPRAAGMAVTMAPDVEARLRMLATKMEKTLNEVIAQALSEFADTWEDHMHTVAALKEDEGRVHLSVPKE